MIGKYEKTNSSYLLLSVSVVEVWKDFRVQPGVWAKCRPLFMEDGQPGIGASVQVSFSTQTSQRIRTRKGQLYCKYLLTVFVLRFENKVPYQYYCCRVWHLTVDFLLFQIKVIKVRRWFWLQVVYIIWGGVGHSFDLTPSRNFWALWGVYCKPRFAANVDKQLIYNKHGMCRRLFNRHCKFYWWYTGANMLECGQKVRRLYHILVMTSITRFLLRRNFFSQIWIRLPRISYHHSIFVFGGENYFLKIARLMPNSHCGVHRSKLDCNKLH